MLSNRYTIGHITGLPFRVSQLWFLAVIFFTYTFSQPAIINQYVTIANLFPGITIQQPFLEAIPAQIIFSMGIVGTVYLSVILHELGHIYGAQKHDISVNGITLWVLGGAAEIIDQPESPREEFEMTIAGPIVSLILAISALAALFATRPLNNDILTTYFIITALLNTGMLILNLLPAFPLDGGRLLRAALASVFDYQRGTRYATHIGKVFALGIGIMSLLAVHILGIVLSAFVFLAAHAEAKRVSGANTVTITSQTPITVTYLDNEQNPTETLFTTGETPPPQGNQNMWDNAMTVPLINSELALETELPTYTGREVTELLQTAGGNVTAYVTDNTDYIVIPDGHEDMYQQLAEKTDTTLITITRLTSILDELRSVYDDTSNIAAEDTTPSNRSETNSPPRYPDDTDDSDIFL